jgi:hypothetical protein
VEPAPDGAGSALPPIGVTSSADDVVTVLDKAWGMRQVPPRAAVCIVRAEQQDTGMLITLVISANIEEISSQRSLHVTDIDVALDAVRHFLVQFAGSSH